MWQQSLSFSIQKLFPERRSTPSSSRSQQGSGKSASFSSGIATPIIQDQHKIHHQVASFLTQGSLVDEGPTAEIAIDISPTIEVPPQSSAPAVLLQPTERDEVQNEVAFGPNPVSLPTPSQFVRIRNKTSINLNVYVPLYQAALKGDWEKANVFIDLYPSALSARITKGQETVLHIAAGAKQTKFVEELVKLMKMTDLELRNKDGNTALCFAAASGITRTAEVMVEKNRHLPAVRGGKGVTPLHMAALLGHRDMVWFLYLVTRDEDLKKEDYVGLLIASIGSDLYDVALHILDRQPKLAVERDLNGETALHVLARKPSAFLCKNRPRIWQRFVHPSILFFSRVLWHAKKVLGIKEVNNQKLPADTQPLKLLKRLWEQFLLLDDAQLGNLLRTPWRPLFIAAELGNFEFVFELVHSYPDLIWKVDEQSRSIFHIAVMHRQEKIFNLIYDIGAHKDLIAAYKDTNNTNMLHLAAKLAPSNRLNIVSGAALQMQRELLWFKEVEKNVQRSYKEMRDTDGRTPQMLFTDEHKGLVKAGERWMKGTASSCMLVATLITTVMFAAIFTVPGGNNNKGTPICLQDKSFVVFAISDAFALFSSVTAILMFLSILASRYAEEDFLECLPKRLIVGLTTLFFSIASMLIAFSATFFLVLGQHLAWVVIPVAITACIPVMLFAFLQFPLLADMIYASYGSGIFSRCNRDMLY